MKLIFTILLSIVYLYANKFDTLKIPISNIKNQTASIKIGNLKIGQSGIVIHYFDNRRYSILANAIVIQTSKNKSTIKFIKSVILKQDAIPTANLIPKDGDIFILNHLYNTSLVIAPNHESQKYIIQKHKNNNFIDIDIFAATLKINNTPIPSKNDIRNYAIKNNIGTIYFYINNNIYIIDTISFRIIDTIKLVLKDKSANSPFFTNVHNIKTGTFNFTGQEKIKNYHEYYSKILGL